MILRLILGGCLLLCLTAMLSGCMFQSGSDAETLEPEDSQRSTAASGTQTTDEETEPVHGVFADRILFGQSAAFSGPAQALGKGMRLGIEAAFHEVNQRGGVHGRRLELIALDDRYEPEAAIANTLQLIEQEKVFALIGAVGTPTSRSAVPVADAAGVPYLAPFTGAAFLRETLNWESVVNLRASYDQETEEMVERLTTDLGIERIAVVYQDDSFGRAGYLGALRALLRRGLAPVATGLYPRNTTFIKKALLDIRQSEPEAVIMVGAYEPLAELIAWARFTGMDPVFVNISFVGSNALAGALQEKDARKGLGVYVTQVVPFPKDANLPITDSYQKALADYAPSEAEPGFVSLEGYLAGRLAIAALERCFLEISRSCLLKSLKGGGVFQLEGLDLFYSRFDNQGSDSVFLTVIGHDGEYHSVNSLKEEVP